MHPATKNKRRLLLAGIGAGIGAADGTVALAASPFHAPNEYARRIALRWEKTATSIAAPTVRTSQASGFLRA